MEIMLKQKNITAMFSSIAIHCNDVVPSIHFSYVISNLYVKFLYCCVIVG